MNKFKFSCKGLNKRTFENNGDRPMAKYLKLLDETESVTSTNRGFRTKNHSVATYEQKIKECVVLILNERLRQMEFIRFDGKFMFFLYEVFDQTYTL